jgi:hypothetical protein
LSDYKESVDILKRWGFAIGPKIRFDLVRNSKTTFTSELRLQMGLVDYIRANYEFRIDNGPLQKYGLYVNGTMIDFNISYPLVLWRDKNAKALRKSFKKNERDIYVN